MKVLVTGGAGFAGSHIVDQFLAAGHEVVVVDNLVNGSTGNVNPQAKFVNMDINDPQIHDLIAAQGIEAIVHQAAQIKVPVSIQDPAYDAQVNIMGTIHLLEAMRKFGLKKFVFAGSAASYGMPEYLPLDEEHPLNPLSFYGLSKKVDEEYIRLYHDLFQVPYVILRYANIYGPRQGASGEGGVISIFMNQMLSDEQAMIEGDGGATRDYIYIGDVARGVVEATGNDAQGTFNLSTQKQVSVNELFQVMKELSGYAKDAVHGPARVGDIYHSVMSNAKVLDAMEWRPTTSLEDGLAKTIAWGREQLSGSQGKGAQSTHGA
ncbi:MAG TPA: NAD-dependent epimerase/dehydratase family protein [Bacilli bacterium]|nr:NAD-dependent epimerase/dehydratase family protein [Bacilli bacterium]